MNTISNESMVGEESVEVVEMDDGLVEVGAVSETKGGLFGASMDNGNGYQFI